MAGPGRAQKHPPGRRLLRAAGFTLQRTDRPSQLAIVRVNRRSSESIDDRPSQSAIVRVNRRSSESISDRPSQFSVVRVNPHPSQSPEAPGRACGRSCPPPSPPLLRNPPTHPEHPPSAPLPLVDLAPPPRRQCRTRRTWR